jgi:hypothetical protein
VITAGDWNSDGKSDIALQVVGASPALDVLTNTTATSGTDTVSITRAEYVTSHSTLRAEATSTRATATLQVFVTSSRQLIGTLSNAGGGRFRGRFSWPVNPQSITVRSNFGGQATRTVTER